MSESTRVHLHLQRTYEAMDQGSVAYTHERDHDKARQLLEAARARLDRAIAEIEREAGDADLAVAVILAEIAALPTTDEEDNR